MYHDCDPVSVTRTTASPLESVKTRRCLSLVMTSSSVPVTTDKPPDGAVLVTPPPSESESQHSMTRCSARLLPSTSSS